MKNKFVVTFKTNVKNEDGSWSIKEVQEETDQPTSSDWLFHQVYTGRSVMLISFEPKANSLKRVFTTYECWELFADSKIPIDTIEIVDKVGFVLEFEKGSWKEIRELINFTYRNLENKYRWVSNGEFSMQLIIER